MHTRYGINKIFETEAFFTAFCTTFEKNYYFPGEAHNFWELVYVADGCAAAAEDGKIYELNAGEIIFHMPMEFHRIWSAKNTSPRCIIMSFALSGTVPDILGSGIFTLNPIMKQILYDIFENAESFIKYGSITDGQLAANNLERLILLLADEQMPRSKRRKTAGTKNYENIISVMNDNIGKRLSTEEIAFLCGLSVANLKKTFKKYSGMGVMEYFNRRKIAKAMQMIEYGNSISEISNELGFSSISYFSAVFKRICSVSPAEYKKSLQA